MLARRLFLSPLPVALSGDTAFEWTMALKIKGWSLVYPAPPAFASVPRKNR